MVFPVPQASNTIRERSGPTADVRSVQKAVKVMMVVVVVRTPEVFRGRVGRGHVLVSGVVVHGRGHQVARHKQRTLFRRPGLNGGARVYVLSQ